MSILESGTIDIVATRRGSAEVRLVIADHVDWSDPYDHCLLLQDKINTYVAAVESGQLRTVSTVDIPPDPRFVIFISALAEVPAEGREFFARAAEFLRGLDIGLEVEQNHGSAD